MEEPDRLKVMKRAYELWEQAGMPQGSAEKFYHQAEEELRNKEKSNPPDTLKSFETKTKSPEGQ
jgi:hypothetical protein